MKDWALSQLLKQATSQSLAAESVSRLSAHFDSLASLAEAFAELVAQRYLAGAMPYEEASRCMNSAMPAIGFEAAPRKFWDVYVAFEDCEALESPDQRAPDLVRATLGE
jgi:hypothetical protein